MFRSIAVALLLLAGPLEAQDSTHVRTQVARADTVAASLKKYCLTKSATGYVCNTRRQLDSLKALELRSHNRVDTVTVVRTDTVKVIQVDTITVVRVDTVVVAPPKDTVVVTPPAPVDSSTPPVVTPPPAIVFTHPFAAPSNGAKLATLPQDTVSVAIPKVTRSYVITNLQAALDSAKDGDELRMAPGTLLNGNFVLKSTPRAGWLTLRTDVPLADTLAFMSVARADSLKLATINTSNSSPALWINPGAHHVYLRALRFTTTFGPMNMIVRAHNDETTVAALPHDIVLAESAVDAGNNDVRRCTWLDIVRGAVVKSSLANCHSNIGDSQGILISNTPGPFRIQGNDIQAGHQTTMFGGSDPRILNVRPCDIVVAYNHLYRPLAWKGVWQAKTLIEQKDACDVLYEGNLIENVHPDAQVGFAFLLKTENQDCTAPWSQSRDVTVRYNRIRNTASGINLATNPSPCKGIDATTFTIYDNIFEPFGYQNGSNGIPLQVLGGVADVVVLHNTWQSTGINLISFDGPPAARMVFSGNIAPQGTYGIKGAGGSVGAGSWNLFTSNGLFQTNIVLGASCSQYPTTTLCPTTVPAVLPLAFDGRAIGADVSKNAIVAP